jgi:1-acyl-sn-glycerol-3-phosphate acyltransferase
MMAAISNFLLRLMGWKLVGYPPKGVTKAVFITAPHTSFVDFYIGRLYCWSRHIPAKIFIKKEAFKWYYGWLLRYVGGIPIDRGKAGNRVEQAAAMLKERDNIFLAITPEGTRKRVEVWKRGFYYIAQKAEVPIIMSFLDYGKKEVGIGPVLEVTGNIENDFKKIEDYYRGMQGKHPEQFNLWEAKKR